MREINHLNPTLSASEQLSAEIIAILFEDTTKSFVVSMCVALLMIVLLKGTSLTSHHAIWLSFIFASYCLRVVIVYLHSKKKSQLISPHVWLNRFRITSIICGLAWGTTGLFIFPTGNITAQTMIALFVAGICAGALINYSIDKITAYAFTGGAMLLLCPALLLEKQTISHIILLMMLVFVIYAAVACKKNGAGYFKQYYATHRSG